MHFTCILLAFPRKLHYIEQHKPSDVKMKSLQVRELPDHIYARLKQDAREQHRSLAQQAIITLEKGLGREEDNRERRRKLFAGFKRVPAKGVTPQEIVEWIREDRER